MSIDLLVIEQKAMSALNAREYAVAVTAFKELLAAQPDYEHGLPHYHLAHALEEIGDLAMARKEYEDALRWAPADPIRLGGYASFLYLHGSPTEAIDAYVRLARLEKATNAKADISDILQALSVLAEKAGLANSEVLSQI